MHAPAGHPQLGALRARGAGSLAAAALAALLAAFYAGSFEIDFYGDDYVFLDRARLDSAGDWPVWFSLERNREGLLDRHHAYRPLSTNVWFGTLHALFGADARCFHAANLALLWLNALLLWRLLARFCASRALGLALAGVYAISSVGFEGQLWLSVVQDLLLTTGVLASWLCYERHRERPSARALAALLAWQLAALLSKETALVLPLLLLLREAWCGERAGAAWRPRLLALASSALLAGGFAWFRIAGFGLPAAGPYALGAGEHALPNLARYASWAGQSLFFAREPWLLLAALLAAALCAFRGGTRSARRFGLGLSCFAAALLPVLFLRAHAYPFYLTLPLVGLVLAAAASLEALGARLPARLRLPLAAAALCAFAWLSFARLEQRLAPLVARSALTRGILAQLRERLPELPRGARLYFERPATLPRDTLFKHRGAVLRVLYDDDSLRVFELDPRDPEAPFALRHGPAPILRLDAQGRLELLEPARADRPPAAGDALR